MVHIVHSGDLHLDSPILSGLITKQTLRTTFESICEYAKNSGAQLVLFSGDIFDNEFVSGSTVSFLISVTEKYSMLEFFFCSGNHDFYSPRSVYNGKFPSNVHMFIRSKIEKIEFPHLNTDVYGFGCEAAHSATDYLKGFTAEKQDRTNIMLFHGNLTDSGGADNYYPVSLEDIAGSGLDYLALGHIHKHSGIKRAGETFYSYCGTPQGRGFDETGKKGIVAGMVGKGRQSLQFVPICKTAFEITECDITGLNNLLAVKDKILADAGQYDKDALRVILTGEVEEDFSFDIKALEESLREYFYYIEIKDSTKIKADFTELASKRTLKGLFVKELLEQETDVNSEIIQKAVRFGLQALSGEGELDCEN